MIFLYTFDFKKETLLEEKMFQFLMLLISMQSAFDCETSVKVRVILYTNDIMVKTYTANHFQNDVEILFGNNKNDFCDTSWFSCAGHSRIELLNELVGSDDIVYMDNDTICHPEFINNIKNIKRPTLYRIEGWHNLEQWCLRHHKKPDLYEYIEKVYISKYSINKKINVINNGVVYLPRCGESKLWIKTVVDVYSDLVKNVGYSYGLDQTSMSLACYLMNCFNVFFYNGSTNETVWHTYCVKNKYRKRIENSDIRIDKNFRTNYKFKMVYHILFMYQKK